MKTKIKTLGAALLVVGFMAGAALLVWNEPVSVNEPILVADDSGCGGGNGDPGNGNPGADNMPNEISA